MDYLKEVSPYLNMELTNNHKLAFKIALDKLGATVENPVNITTWMFIEATNAIHPTSPNVLIFKDQITRESFKISYDLYDLAI
tara:strand:+ start:476 stop:724 length:249 start_codon:yes stop_codon:yes gene_type:complete